MSPGARSTSLQWTSANPSWTSCQPLFSPRLFNAMSPTILGFTSCQWLKFVTTWYVRIRLRTMPRSFAAIYGSFNVWGVGMGASLFGKSLGIRKAGKWLKHLRRSGRGSFRGVVAYFDRPTIGAQNAGDLRCISKAIYQPIQVRIPVFGKSKSTWTCRDDDGIVLLIWTLSSTCHWWLTGKNGKDIEVNISNYCFL